MWHPDAPWPLPELGGSRAPQACPSTRGCLQPVCCGKADGESISGKGQLSSRKHAGEGVPQTLGPPSSLTSWYPGCAPTPTPEPGIYLSWGPSFAVILCSNRQRRSQQVSWLLSVWKANRILRRSEGRRLGRSRAGFNPPAMLLGECPTAPGAEQSRRMVRAQHRSFGNLWLRVLQPKGYDTQPYSAGQGTPSLSPPKGRRLSCSARAARPAAPQQALRDL